MNIVIKNILRRSLPETVHIIPLGHEIDRAVKPFAKTTADRAYVLTIPKDADLDPEMVKKQYYFVERVMAQLEKYGIGARIITLNMFDILDVLAIVSRIIKIEKEAGNTVLVNMSSCGRKTSVAVTLAAMIHDGEIYYVSADRYATGGDSTEELEHGLSIVNDVRTEMIHNFRIMMPGDDEIKLLVELKKWKEKIARGEKKEDMGSDDIITFLHTEGVGGFENLPPSKRTREGSSGETEYRSGGERRALLNRINRGFLKNLEDLGYVKRTWRGKRFFISITQAGEYIAAVSGEFPCCDVDGRPI